MSTVISPLFYYGIPLTSTCTVYRNAGDKDKVWTFGSGPRQCIGKLLSTTLLKVSGKNNFNLTVDLSRTSRIMFTHISVYFEFKDLSM